MHFLIWLLNLFSTIFCCCLVCSIFECKKRVANIPVPGILIWVLFYWLKECCCWRRYDFETEIKRVFVQNESVKDYFTIFTIPRQQSMEREWRGAEEGFEKDLVFCFDWKGLSKKFWKSRNQNIADLLSIISYFNYDLNLD